MTIDTTGCVNNTILTHSGTYFDYASPKPEHVSLGDIAKGLSNTCRFGGQCQFYSVAEHCWHCAEEGLSIGGRELALHALMHDAAEAYVGDMPKPLKNMMPEFRRLEDRVEAVISLKFGLSCLFDQEVKQIDLRMLKTEKLLLFPTDGLEWSGFAELDAFDRSLFHWTPSQSQSRFLEMWNRLNR